MSWTSSARSMSAEMPRQLCTTTPSATNEWSLDMVRSITSIEPASLNSMTLLQTSCPSSTHATVRKSMSSVLDAATFSA